jgi:hypothetical protein
MANYNVSEHWESYEVSDKLLKNQIIANNNVGICRELHDK